MALAANVLRSQKRDQSLSLEVKTAVNIFQGAMVCVDATGYAIPAADVAANIFQGIAQEQKDNTSGASGALKVIVERPDRFIATLASAAITDIGLDVYISDDDTLTKTVGNGVYVGKVVRFVGTNLVEVKPIYSKAIIAAAIADAGAATASDPAACDAMTQGAYASSTSLTDPPTKAEMEAELALIDTATDQTIVDTAALKAAIDLNNVEIDALIVDRAANKTTIDAILAAMRAAGLLIT